MKGSSDHAIYIIDAVKGTKKRTLYNNLWALGVGHDRRHHA